MNAGWAMAALLLVGAGPEPLLTSMANSGHVYDLTVFDGQVWAATSGGIWVHDVKSGAVIAHLGTQDGLTQAAVRDLGVLDAPGGPQLWAAGSHGLAVAVARPSSDGVPQFEPRVEPVGAWLPHLLSVDHENGRLVTARLDDDERGLTLGTHAGQVQWTTAGGPRAVGVPGPVLALARVADDMVVVSTGGIFAIDERGRLEPRWTAVTGTDLTSALGTKGGLIVGRADGAIYRLDAAGVARLRAGDGREVTAVLPVDDRLFFGLKGAGLFLQVDAASSAVRALTPASPLCFGHVGALTEHRGRLVVGGFEGGLCFVEEKVPNNQPSAVNRRLRSDLILSLASLDDTLWIGTSYGLGLREPRRRTARRGRSSSGRLWTRVLAPSFNNPLGLSGYGIVAMAEGPDHLFLSDGRGVSRMAKKDRKDVVRYRNLPGLAEGITDLAVAGEHVWVGTEKAGVSVQTEEGWRAFGSADGLAEEWVVKLAAAPDGRVWVGHSLRGVSFHDGERWRVIDEEDGLPDGSVISMAYDADHDVVWVGTQGGLAVIDAEDGGVRRTFGTADGMPDQRVHAILLRGASPDRVEPQIVLGTEGGLAFGDRAALLTTTNTGREL